MGVEGGGELTSTLMLRVACIPQLQTLKLLMSESTTSDRRLVKVIYFPIPIRIAGRP